MKKIKVIYWIFTSLFAFVMVSSAIPDIISHPVAIEGFRKMGYPAYLLPFVGIAKLLGVFAILVPGFPRIKEWAYAGLFIDLVGATYSIIASGEPAPAWSFMAVPLFLAIGSYVYHHKKVGAKSQRANNYVVNQSNYFQNENAQVANAGIA